MLDFRVQGFDILPDILGFILFAVGINALLAYSEHFKQARSLNYAMIFISIFFISGQSSSYGLLLGIISIIVTWYLVFNIFMGIRDMAAQAGQVDLQEEAETRWHQYRQLLIASFVSFILIIIPPLAFIMFFVLLIVSIIVLVGILQFLTKCDERLL
ncbi:MAG: hypothetical protein NUK65_12485 [Firmicutes bacterium]|nr:hypothetical protein [Bacillota bacterium]